MTDKTGIKSPHPNEAEYGSKTWDVLTSLGLAATTGVPLPPSVIKSLRKALDRLICGATDYGMTFIESATAKRKLLDEGKQLVLIEAAKAAGVKVVNNDDLMERAVDVFASELISKQTNRDKIFRLAIGEINQAKNFDNSESTIDDDWLGDFSTLASQRSNEDVQRLLAKILAGEIRQPGTFSPLTLHILSTLTPAVAKSFEALCNLSLTWEQTKDLSFVPYGPFPEFIHKGLPEFGVSFGQLLNMQNYGLLAPKLDTEFKEESPISEVTLEIGGKQLQLKSKTGDPVKISLRATPLSIPGAELRGIISLEAPPTYMQKQIEYFNKMGFDVTVK